MIWNHIQRIFDTILCDLLFNFKGFFLFSRLACILKWILFCICALYLSYRYFCWIWRISKNYENLSIWNIHSLLSTSVYVMLCGQCRFNNDNKSLYHKYRHRSISIIFNRPWYGTHFFSVSIVFFFSCIFFFHLFSLSFSCLWKMPVRQQEKKK